MKTEPNVPFYTNLAKERICFSLVKVGGNEDAFTGDVFSVSPFSRGDAPQSARVLL